MTSPRCTQLLRVAGRDRTDFEPILSVVSGDTVTTAYSAGRRTRASVLVRGQVTGELRPEHSSQKHRESETAWGYKHQGKGGLWGCTLAAPTLRSSTESETEAENLRAATRQAKSA